MIGDEFHQPGFEAATSGPKHLGETDAMPCTELSAPFGANWPARYIASCPNTPSSLRVNVALLTDDELVVVETHYLGCDDCFRKIEAQDGFGETRQSVPNAPELPRKRWSPLGVLMIIIILGGLIICAYWLLWARTHS